MLLYLLMTLLTLGRFDYPAGVLAYPTSRQALIINQLTDSPTISIYRILRPLPPIKKSPLSRPAIFISAESGIVIDELSGQILWQKNPEAVLPIASLTKLATAMVFLETNPDFKKEVTIEKEDLVEADGSRLQVKAGEKLTVGDLFYTSLVGSANNATKAMVRSTGLSVQEFIARMNKLTQDLGLTRTVFYEVTGLDPRNTSTVQEYARLASYAMRQSQIKNALLMPEYDFTTIGRGQPHRIKNTDSLLSEQELHLAGAKTGYLDEAGYTFTCRSQDGGHSLMVVLFRSVSSEGRFAEAKALLKWAWSNFSWQ